MYLGHNPSSSFLESLDAFAGLVLLWHFYYYYLSLFLSSASFRDSSPEEEEDDGFHADASVSVTGGSTQPFVSFISSFVHFMHSIYDLVCSDGPAAQEPSSSDDPSQVVMLPEIQEEKLRPFYLTLPGLGYVGLSLHLIFVVLNHIRPLSVFRAMVALGQTVDSFDQLPYVMIDDVAKFFSRHSLQYVDVSLIACIISCVLQCPCCLALFRWSWSLL